MSGEAGVGHLVHYLSPHGGMFHAIASGFGSFDAKGDWSKVTCPACLAHRPAPDAAGIEAALAAGLAAHAPRTQPPMGLVVGCSCGWRIGRTMYEGYDAHIAAALLPVVTQAQAEALREAADAIAAWRRMQS